MQTLMVLYDARCELCCYVREWLAEQPTYVELLFLAADSPEARQRFPDLNHAATLIDLTVVSDSGDVYTGAPGWFMCLWALREYRGWALRLSAPAHMEQARRFITWVSQNRQRLRTRKPPVCSAEDHSACHIVTGES
jgi:predicted DCC family thiol-disulfide oxidoreductase YuxK